MKAFKKFKKFKDEGIDNLITDNGYAHKDSLHGDVIVIALCMIIIMVLLYLGVRLILS